MTSGTMIILLLLMAMVLHNGLTAIVGFEAVENSLLAKLGLNRRPEVDKNVKVPPATMKLYRAMMEENTAMTSHLPLPGSHTSSANTVRTYPDQGSIPINPKSQRYRLQFDINGLPERERVKAAEVRVTMMLLDPERRRDDEFVHILVHDIVEPGARGLSKPTLRLLDSKSIRLSSSKSKEEISFDVTPAMERLSETNFDGNHGVLIQCVTVPGSRTRLIDVLDFQSPVKPLLMVYTDDGTNKKSTLADMMRRTKRAADEPKKRSKKKKEICQRKPLYVDFEQVGFNDWIHAPQGYDAFYCQGECTFPLANHMNASNHAVMQTLMNSINSNVPRSCCIPTRLRSQTLLYMDDEKNLVVKTYPDMAVEECGCR